MIDGFSSLDEMGLELSPDQLFGEVVDAVHRVFPAGLKGIHGGWEPEVATATGNENKRVFQITGLQGLDDGSIDIDGDNGVVIGVHDEGRDIKLEEVLVAGKGQLFIVSLNVFVTVEANGEIRVKVDDGVGFGQVVDGDGALAAAPGGEEVLLGDKDVNQGGNGEEGLPGAAGVVIGKIADGISAGGQAGTGEEPGGGSIGNGVGGHDDPTHGPTGCYDGSGPVAILD